MTENTDRESTQFAQDCEDFLKQDRTRNLLAAIIQNPRDNEQRGIFADYVSDHFPNERLGGALAALWCKETEYDEAQTAYNKAQEDVDKKAALKAALEAYKNAFNAVKKMPQFSAALHQSSINDEGDIVIPAADFFANAELLTKTLGVRRVFLNNVSNGKKKVSEKNLAPFQKTEALQYLTGLRLWRANIDAVGTQALVQALAQSPHLKNLTKLNLKANNIGAEGAQALAQSPHLKNLTELDLHSNNIGDDGLKALAQSPNMAKLTELNLENNNIGALGAQALAQSPHFQNLTTLKLWGNNISAAGAQALALAPHFQNLTTLDLSSTRIGDAGVEALAQSPHFQNLTTLDLSSTYIGDAGVEALVTSQAFPNLTTLGLGYNMNITDASEMRLRDAGWSTNNSKYTWTRPARQPSPEVRVAAPEAQRGL